jgi:hypothetical protein
MARLLIKYRSSDGSLSTRSLSDWVSVGPDAIEAHCHFRGERRTFNLMSILSAVDEETGELLPNLWRFFSLDREPDGKERLVAQLGERLIAIKVIKFYAMSTRGFAKRERDHILNFALQGVPTSVPRDEFDLWLQKLWAGDVYAYKAGDNREYRENIAAIPRNLLPAVRVTAEFIARGSGRRPISPEEADRIARDFDAT